MLEPEASAAGVGLGAVGTQRELGQPTEGLAGPAKDSFWNVLREDGPALTSMLTETFDGWVGSGPRWGTKSCRAPLTAGPDADETGGVGKAFVVLSEGLQELGRRQSLRCLPVVCPSEREVEQEWTEPSGIPGGLLCTWNRQVSSLGAGQADHGVRSEGWALRPWTAGRPRRSPREPRGWLAMVAERDRRRVAWSPSPRPAPEGARSALALRAMGRLQGLHGRGAAGFPAWPSAQTRGPVEALGGAAAVLWLLRREPLGALPAPLCSRHKTEGRSPRRKMDLTQK